jgi:glutathione S-transferase
MPAALSIAHRGWRGQENVMKLYYSPGACSLASHIALEEAGATYTAEKVDLKNKVTESGADFRKVSARGAVPVLALDDGEVLGEGVAIMQYVTDKAKPGALPAVGTLARARLHEALNFISTEVHKTYSPLFRGLEGAAKEAQLALLDSRLALVEEKLADGRNYLLGKDFTPADGYLFTVTNWSKPMGHDVSKFPRLAALRDRIAARPAVQKAMKAEGLI